MAMFISPTTHHARNVPRIHRSRAQYAHATIIAANRPAATTFDACPSITACRAAEPNARPAHARRPNVAVSIALLTQIQTHRRRETHPWPTMFLDLCGFTAYRSAYNPRSFT